MSLAHLPVAAFCALWEYPSVGKEFLLAAISFGLVGDLL